MADFAAAGGAKTKLRNASSASQAESTLATGYLMNTFGLLGLSAMLVIAAWQQQVAVVVLLSFFLAAAGLAKLWSRFSLAGVSGRRSLSRNRAFPGESVDLHFELFNRKPLPLPWIQLVQPLAPHLCGATTCSAVEPSLRREISYTTSLLWYSRARWRRQLTCSRRGYFRIEPIQLNSGDIFGFYSRSKRLMPADHLVVYPKIYPVDRVPVASLQPMGDSPSPRRLFQDPTCMIGIRDHHPRDGRRHIHWKSSARQQRLQAKVYEPMTTLQVALIVDVESFSSANKGCEDDFELALSTAASMARYWIDRQRAAVGLYMNSRSTDSDEAVSLPPSTGARQLMNILEALAKATLRSTGPFPAFLAGAGQALPGDATLVFIAARPYEELRLFVSRSMQDGRHLLLVTVGTQEDYHWEMSLPRYTVREPGDLMQWQSKGRP
jgi:uncharacterized protein (DUF58 family)